MQVAVVQTSPVFGDVGGNIRSAVELMETATADLYVLPELFNTGYVFTEKAEVDRLAEDPLGPTHQALWVSKGRWR
jgi:predicted amidohydrolase